MGGTSRGVLTQLKTDQEHCSKHLTPTQRHSGAERALPLKAECPRTGTFLLRVA